ncbi:MAG: hypothetical protein LBJ61_05015 [Deltaproteobacteria bacterium]|nr:hypothetical protein [Deltaproteobacteria bacterium]
MNREIVSGFALSPAEIGLATTSESLGRPADIDTFPRWPINGPRRPASALF